MKQLLFLLIPFFVGCNCTKKTTSINTGSTASYEVLFQSNYGGNEEKSYQVIHSLEDLQNTLGNPLLENNQEFNSRLAQIDFDKQAVVILHMGTRNTGGYSIGIEEVLVTDDTTYVKVKETTPEPGMNVTMALTAPFCIAVINTNKNILFQ